MAKQRKFIASLIALLALTALSGCTTSGDKSNNPQSGGDNSNVSGDTQGKTSDPNAPVPGDANWVDYTNSATVRLSLDYKVEFLCVAKLGY